MDNFFGWDYTDNLIWFWEKWCTHQQVKLLLLWESISCPFEDRKQEHGKALKIIGFWVDINTGSISLPPSTASDIIMKIDLFLATPGHSPSLHLWQRLAGHLNWMLNVLPWGQPALSEVYHKISGKTWSHHGISINAGVIADLTWFERHHSFCHQNTLYWCRNVGWWQCWHGNLDRCKPLQHPGFCLLQQGMDLPHQASTQGSEGGYLFPWTACHHHCCPPCWLSSTHPTLHSCLDWQFGFCQCIELPSCCWVNAQCTIASHHQHHPLDWDGSSCLVHRGE